MTSYRSWVEIEIAALQHNAAVAQARLGPEVELLAVIKANAYGHGIAPVAQALAGQAHLFGVACLTEALQARAVVPHPLLILGPALADERAEIVAQGFIATVSSFAEAQAFAAVAHDQPALVNCEIDTGMGRMGIAERDALTELQRIAALPGLQIHSISTHLPSADEDESYTSAQLERFAALVAQLRVSVPGNYRVHALLSAGILGFPQHRFQIARAGLMLYGVSPDPNFQAELRVPLTWKSRIVLLRDLAPGDAVSYGRTWVAQRPTRVATLPLGYADGFPRALSNRDATVLVRGRRCPVLGRVTMDLTLVDVTDVPEVSLGDEVVLLGRQGIEEITAREMAARASTIAWEIFTGIGSRVGRVYL